MNSDESENTEKRSGFFDLSEIGKYYFRKKNPSQKKNLNLRMMHGINRIAIFMFLAAIFYLVIKHVFIY